MLNCSYSSVLAAFLFQGIVYTTNVPTNEDLGTWWLQSELQGALVWWLASRSLWLWGLGLLFPLLCWAQSNQDVWPQVFSTVEGLWTDLSLTSGGCCFFAFLFLFIYVFFGDICFLSVFYYRHSSWKTSHFHMWSVLQKVWRLVQSIHGCYL